MMINDFSKNLLNYAMKHGITCVIKNDIPEDFPPFFKIKDRNKTVVINGNWKKQDQIPFIIAHEISHALTCDENDMVLYFSTLLSTKYEYKANCGAARLLIPFYMENIDDVSQINVNDFMVMFDLPNKMYDICVRELKNYVNK